MLICAAWRPRVRALTRFILCKRRLVFTNERSTSIRISRWHGADFRARIRVCIHPLEIRRKRPNAPSRRAQKLQPDSPETLLALAQYQYSELHDYDAARTTFLRVSKMLPGNSEIPAALAQIARHQGKWDDAVAYYDQALVLDPRNVELLTETADNYDDLRRFDDALKLYDRALEIRPNDLDLLASKAGIYQAQGNLARGRKVSRRGERTYSLLRSSARESGRN